MQTSSTFNPGFSLNSQNLAFLQAITAVLDHQQPCHWAYLVRVGRRPNLTMDLIKEIVDYQDMLTEKSWEELIEIDPLDLEDEVTPLGACSINPDKAVIDAVVAYYGG